MSVINKTMKTFNVPDGSNTICYEIFDDKGRKAIAKDWASNSFAAYAVGEYVMKDGIVYRFTTAHTAGSSWSSSEVVETNLCAEITGLKSAIVGETKTFIGYYDSQGSSGIGGNIYKSSTLKLEKGQVLKTIKTYAVSSPVDNFALFLLDSDNKIIKKVTKQGSSLSSGWNTVDFENFYIEQDTYLAVSGGSVRFSYSAQEKTEYYSDGLFECSASYVSSDVGDTLTFTQNVPERYYEFSVEVEYYVRGINDRLTILEEKVDLLEGEISLTDFIMPKVRDTSEEGYTLIGKWYKFSTYDNCANCGGASILFKVKGATSVLADIKQIIHPSHPEYVMSVEPYIAYSVDGGSFTRTQINSDASNPGITIPIPTTDEHFVWIVIDGMCLSSGPLNRKSGWSGVYIKSITTDGTMYKVTPAARQILFVGDSILEGINTLGTTSTSEANSAVNEFSFKTARKLNSIPILQGYGGSTSDSGIQYERYSWVDGQRNEYILNNPDLIVVEYGYNDINAGYSESTFKEYYNTLLDLLASHYTGVPIICLIPFKQSFAKAIQEMAAARSYCYCIETADYSITYSDTAHPDAAGATSIANSLSEDIINLITKEFFMD